MWINDFMSPFGFTLHYVWLKGWKIENKPTEKGRKGEGEEFLSFLVFGRRERKKYRKEKVKAESYGKLTSEIASKLRLVSFYIVKCLHILQICSKTDC